MDETVPVVPAEVSFIAITPVTRGDAVECGKCGSKKREGAACPGCGDES